MNKVYKVKPTFLLFLCLVLANYSLKGAIPFALDNTIKTEFPISDSLLFKVISKGAAAGEYQAFPDAIRLDNGDIVAVFYAGNTHITQVSEAYPRAGRICFVRSKDEGRTWSAPAIIFDDAEDNRDPHIMQLKDGTVLLSFFNYRIKPKHGEVRIIRSFDNAETWEKESKLISPDSFASAQIRELKSGLLILPVYIEIAKNDYRIGIIRSLDKGTTWEKITRIGEESHFNVNETDIIQLKNKTLYAVIRGSFKDRINMRYAASKDDGKSWTNLMNLGFIGDAPSFTRLKSGDIILSYRGYFVNKDNTGSPYTCFRISKNDGESWQGPYLVDKHGGAYASTIELKDKSISIVYYEEGVGSAIRAVRFKKPKKIKGTQFKEPVPVKSLSLD